MVVELRHRTAEIQSANGLFRFVFALCASIALIMPGDATNAQTAEGQEHETPIFVPPDIGAPEDRAGAGTRDIDQTTGPVRLLVPAGGGLTSSPTPPLVWELRSGFRGTVRSTVAAPSGAGVVFEQTSTFPPGLYGFDLSRSDLRLSEGVLYRWSLELTGDSGLIARSVALIERVADDGRPPGAAGRWFDVLSRLVSIDLSTRARPTDRQDLEALLSAGGLTP